MKNKIFYLPLISLSLCLTACPFRFSDNGAWKERYGTPELLLENAMDDAYVYLYDDQNYFEDEDSVIKDAIKEAAPFENGNSQSTPKDIKYFTYVANWTPATTGPNYVHLSIWKNGFVRIHRKSSLGPHEYLYFSTSEEKATVLVDMVFSMLENN